MSIHPIHGTKQIENSYREYLLTSFHMNNKVIMDQFEDLLKEKNKFVKGPYLEMTNPYKEGVTIDHLIREGVLSPLMRTLNQKDIPSSRPLYVHQEEAIRKAIQGRNFVVATGTGSGKTESFLLPVFNYLFREKERGTLNSGVRALLVYPMNALANDQLKRLRTLLANTPEITFGRFTGETKNSKKEAHSYYKNRNDGQEPLSNELLSREEMRENPPHILITNYAMLEYLLLRPGDTNFFDGPTSDKWKFIILDEAHTYNGAKGIEVGMLLRRLKDRVLKEKPMRGTLQCIATSATLGSGPDAKPKVMEFAEKLFNEPFYWDEENIDHQDLVEAVRVDYDEHFTYWGVPDWRAYKYLKETMESETLIVDKEKLLSFGFPSSIINPIPCEPMSSQYILYELLKGTEHLQRLRNSLKTKPRVLSEIVQEVLEIDFTEKSLYLEPKIAEEILTTFVELAVRAKRIENELPLLPARYHVFVRAIEGAYVQFLPKPKLHLDAKKEIKDGKISYPLFEMGVCSQCGQIHLIGDEQEGKLRQKSVNNPDPELNFTAYMVLNDKEFSSVIDEDEEVIAGEEGQGELRVYEVCPGCASIHPMGAKKSVCCELYGQVKPLLVTKEQIRRNQQAKCHNCGKRSGNPIRLFTTGQDAPTSVLVTSLYQELIKSNTLTVNLENETEIANDDPFGFIESSQEKKSSTEYQPQKLLVFSDSRQDAAFFAPYLERTHSTIMWKRLIYQALNLLKGKDLSLDDLTYKVRELAEEAHLFSGTTTKQTKESTVQTHLIRELLQMEKRISLEGTGLVSFRVPIPEMFKQNLNSLAKSFSLEPDEVWTVFEVLFNSFRISNSISYPDLVDPQDNLFAPRNRRGYMNGHQAVSSYNVLAWVPSESRTNRRVDYLARIYTKKGYTNQDALSKAKELLSNIWSGLITSQRLPEFFEKTNVSGAGTVFIMNYLSWRWVLGDHTDWYKCSHCGNWTTHNVENICPEIKCNGTLIIGDPKQGHNHYRNLYTGLIPMKMTTKEHTAQLSSDQATMYQQDFIDNKINVLSCSTTFEMGVDVGGLESVFMRNVPPETANYIQRAGRAGRRKSTVAYSLTYAQRRSHDLSYFKNPENIIAGAINPPVFKVDNIKIIRRHIHSVAFSAFFRENPSFYGKGGKIEDFLRSSSSKDIQGVTLLREFLNSRPKSILKSLQRIVPEVAQNDLGIFTWEWIEEFCGLKGILTKAEGMYVQDINNLKQLIELRYKQQKGIDSIQKMIRTIMDRELIQFLSSTNVLPKYGFPVDVVSMQLQEKNAPISLDRDLAIAISEYAPGSQIVADGSIYQSIGVKRLPQYELPSVQYQHCTCGHYQTVSRHEKDRNNETVVCESCMEPVNIQSFISPIFGFTSVKGDKPGEFRPEKAFRSRVFFSEYELNDQDVTREREGDLMVGQLYMNWKYSPFGKLAVVNEGKGRGYFICQSCGIEKSFSALKGRQHNTPWGGKCSGSFERVLLGHEFMTDVFELKIEGVLREFTVVEGFWHSLLYGFLDSMAQILGIDRKDIDGCIYYKDRTQPSLIIFDNVPGGAGYTKEISSQLKRILEGVIEKLKDCTCGPETSCYGCLKNYSNQYIHDYLSRGTVVQALENAFNISHV